MAGIVKETGENEGEWYTWMSRKDGREVEVDKGKETDGRA